MKPTFIFFHQGTDPSVPSSLVDSIRWSMSDATIIQCSDKTSVEVPGVDRVDRTSLDPSRIMMSRLTAFASLSLREPALYLDTDMLLLQPLDPAALLADGSNAAVCRRSFQRNAIFNHRMKGLSFSEYEGMTLDQVFPIIACTTATDRPEFWEDCVYALEILDEKYHYWYGDQEALKVVASSPQHRIRHLPEAIYACLPEAMRSDVDQPFILHFKGHTRKLLLREWHTKLGAAARP